MKEQTVQLNSGQRMPLLGLGTYAMQGRVAEEAILQAVDLGCRLFDTAQMYANEKEVGRALRACGLPRQKALLYAAKMMEGTGKLTLDTGLHPGVLKDQVCSPGGSTIAGVRVMEERGVRGAVMDAVIAAEHRNSELGKQ